MMLLRLIGDNGGSIESLKLLCVIVMATIEEILVEVIEETSIVIKSKYFGCNEKVFNKKWLAESNVAQTLLSHSRVMSDTCLTRISDTCVVCILKNFTRFCMSCSCCCRCVRVT